MLEFMMNLPLFVGKKTACPWGLSSPGASFVDGEEFREDFHVQRGSCEVPLRFFFRTVEVVTS